MNVRKYKEKEERINSISHFIGGGVSAFLTIPVVIYALIERNYTKAFAFGIYSLCIMTMFFSSATYHMARNLMVKARLRLWDHSSIFLSIAGTYTPIILVGLKGIFPRVMLILIWIIAIAGIIYKAISFYKGGLDRSKNISVAIYLVMGWLSLLILRRIVIELGWAFMFFLFGGGLLYTIGVYFYKNNKIRYNHAIWHFFIIGATLFMYLGIVKDLALK